MACDAGQHSALQCSVYWEGTGELAQQGIYTYRGMPLSQDELVAFDGRTLYIEGKALVYEPSTNAP